MTSTVSTGNPLHPHPLLVDLVVEHLFSHLSKDSLLIARLVCQRWRALCAPFLKRTRIPAIRVTTSGEVFEFISLLISMPPAAPWKRFALDYFSPRIPRNEIQLFFDACSDSLEELTILPAAGADLVELFSTLLRTVPGVETLKLEGLRSLVTNQLSQTVSQYLRYDYGVNRIGEFLSWYAKESDSSPKGKFWKLQDLRIVVQIEWDTPKLSLEFFQALLRMMPNLSSLTVSCLDVTAESTTIPGLVRALLATPDTAAQLTSLRIDDLDEASLGSLARLRGLGLKKLSLLSLSVSVREETVAAFLRSQATTLEELSVGGQYCCGGNELRLRLDSQSMEKLRTLNFVGGLYIGSHFEYLKVLTWEDLQYDQLPVLENLGLWHLTQHAMNCVFPEGPTVYPSNGVKSVNFIGGVEAIDPQKMRRIGSLFPNIETLGVCIANRESISVAFETWPRLRSLHLNIIAVIPKLDYYFTGKCVNCPTVTRVGQGVHIPFPSDHLNESTSIVNLQELQSLVINMNFQPGRSGPCLRPADVEAYVTDVTANAILELKQLKSLSINRSEISQEWVWKLRRDLKLEKCVIRDSEGGLICISPPAAAAAAQLQEDSEDEYFSATEGC